MPKNLMSQYLFIYLCIYILKASFPLVLATGQRTEPWPPIQHMLFCRSFFECHSCPSTINFQQPLSFEGSSSIPSGQGGGAWSIRVFNFPLQKYTPRIFFLVN